MTAPLTLPATITAPTFAMHVRDGLYCVTVTYPAQTLTVCYAAKPDNPTLTGSILARRLRRFTRKETA